MRRIHRKGGGHQICAKIEAMGARGDGVTHFEDGVPLFVPFSLPGEQVRVRTAARSGAGVRGDLIELLTQSPERIDPPCPHFGRCGGCQLQHWGRQYEISWKEDQVRAAIGRAGYETSCMDPLFQPSPVVRRRARFASQGGRFGFRERWGHEITDLRGCLTLDPALLRFVDAVALLHIPTTALDWTLTTTPAGLDISVQGQGEPPKPLDIERWVHTLGTFNGSADEVRPGEQNIALARLTWNSEILLENDAPRIDMGGLSPILPPGGFLQPSMGGQTALQQAVLAAIPETANWVGDLYCGLGTFAIALAARGHRIQGFESFAPAVAALDAAVRRDFTNAFKIHVGLRDLNLYPLRGDELSGFDAMVFNPPRSGARAQVRYLAQSSISTLVSVSCNLNTWARDAEILRAGGYRLTRLSPIDQFPFTPHVETVSVFQR